MNEAFPSFPEPVGDRRRLAPPSPPPARTVLEALADWRGPARLEATVEAMVDCAFIAGWSARALADRERPPSAEPQLRLARENVGFRRLEQLEEHDGPDYI